MRMDWHKAWCFLKSLPAWEQIGLAVLFFLGLPVMVTRFVYGLILMRMEDARERVRSKRQSTTASTSFQITEDEIITESRLPRWLVRRALRWKKRKKVLKN